jgi:lysophospholipase L1-like esterase
MLRLLLPLLLIAPLFAADPAINAPASSTLQTPVLDIVYLGDSITYGAFIPDADRDTKAPPAICSRQIESKLKGVTVFFSNQGHGGHTTVDFLPSSHSDFPQAEDAAKKLQADHPGKLVFSIMLGTNDSASNMTNGAPVSPAKYGDNLTAIIDQLLADFPAAEIVVHRPIWYSPNTHNAATYEQAGLDRLQTYVPVTQSVVDAENGSHLGHVHLGDVLAYSYFEQNHLKELKPEEGAKGTFYLHPNLIGAASLGGFWADGIISSLR